MILFTVFKGYINVIGKNGKREVKEASPSIDIQALHFTDETTKGICDNTLVSTNYTAWLISNRSEMRFHILFYIAIEF